MSGIPEEKFSRGPIAWMARNGVAANLLMLFFLAGGFVAFKTITQEVFPDIQQDVVSVRVSYPGASPEEVEQGVLLAVEEALTGLVGIEEITATASEGRASVRAELLDNVDPIQVYQDIKSEVDRITTLPEDAEKPEVSLDVRRREVIEIAVYGDADDTALKSLAERGREKLLQDKDITQVDIDGSRDLEIIIEIPQENLRRYGLMLSQVADKLKTASVDVPGGALKTETGEILVRMTERRDFGREFANIPVISGKGGTQVLLGDIAEIHDGLEDAERYSNYNGKRAVMLEVYRVGNQTPTEVAEAAKRVMEEIRHDLPEGVEIAVRRNMADIYKQRAFLLLKNGAIGLTLVLLLLGSFLELRLAFWVMMGIPISFLGSLLLMPISGLSINMITMFAYILALGIVVDDAIVVGENIYRYHQEGLPFMKASIMGVREVSMPVAFSILTNVVAFVPIYMLSGMMGRVMGMLPVVVISVFLISWVESIFILPAHLAHHRERRRKGLSAWLHNRQRRFSDWFRNWVHTRYTPFLSLCLDHRYVVMAVALSILALTVGYVGSGRMGFEMFPRVESDYAYATAMLPYGSPVDKTAGVADRLARVARQVAEDAGCPELIEGIYARIGRDGTHNLDVRVYLAGPEIRKRTMSTREFTDKWREAVGRVKEAEFIKFQSDRGGPGSGSALTIELSHSNVETLEKAAVDLADVLDTFPRVSDIDDGFQLGKEQLSFTIRPEGRSLGLTANEVARQVRNAYEGVRVLRQQRGRNELTVRIRLPLDERMSEGNLDRMMLRTPIGGEVPLKDAVDVSRGRAYTSISHRKGRRTMSVSADVKPRAEVGQVISALNSGALKKLTRRYPGLTYSYEGRQAEHRKSIGSLWQTLPVVLAAIYALLAVPFRSYVQPLIVMVSIPFGIVGAVIGHMIMGFNLSLMGVIGIVALSGVVVNDSLVFVDFANRRRLEGACIRESLLDAGRKRFRPILLTTLTTFGGLAPMIFETSRQARFLIPMALSLGYGLVFATAITLVLVPSLYEILEDTRAVFSKIPWKSR